MVYGSQATWPPSAADLLPAMPVGTVDRSRGGAASLGNLEYGHAVFEPFRAPRSGDFSAARFYSYRSVAPAKDAQTLARFDDGAPAVMERTVGRGRVLLWTSTLDLFWNDLALKPVFLPFVHQLARRLADYRERPTGDGRAGHRPVAGRAIRASRGRRLAPGGERLPLEGDAGRVLDLTEQGYYEIREQGRQSQFVTVAASNVELAESDRTAVDPAEIVGGGRRRADQCRRSRRPDAHPRRSPGEGATNLVVPALRGYPAIDGRIRARAPHVTRQRLITKKPQRLRDSEVFGGCDADRNREAFRFL